MAADGNGDLRVPDLRTIKELCQPSLNGRGGPISPIAIQAANFRLKNDMIQQVQNSCQFHGLSGDDANKHLDKFLHVIQSIKANGVTDDALSLYLFPHSLTHHAIAWFDHAFYNGLTLRHRDTINVAAEGTFMKRRPEECYDLIENMTTHHNDWDTSAQRINQQVIAVTPNCETCGGPHSFSDCPTTIGQPQNVYAAGAYQVHEDEYRFIFGFRKSPGNTITNPKKELKGITTRSGTANQRPTIPTTSSFLPLIVERETEVTKDTVHPTNNGSTKDIQPRVVQTESPILNSEPVVAPIIEPVVAPVSAPNPNQKLSIPYPTRMHDQTLRNKANDQRENFFQIFKDLNFNISFADALILMPKFGPSIKSLLTNKDKLFELARTPLNEHCSAVLLKKLLEKLGDPGKFLISYDFPGMAECLALADLGASINLMPLFVWNKLSLLELTLTLMTLELADRSISQSIGVAEDVCVKVGNFYFSADFVVIDFDVDPRVPLILGRSFLKTKRDLIDVFERELTLLVGKEAITFNLDQTLRYSANYNDMMANQIDVIDLACEECSQDVLGFSDVIAKVDAFLALEDDPTSPEVDQSYVDTEGDILLLEAFLNNDPSLPPPNQGNYLPQDLPPHLEYAFLEGDDKLLVIVAKDSSVEEKTALITVLKSHKRAIAWKLFDIKGTDPEFCTHKILMEDDFEPAVQHQRRVNPKIYDVIKNEVLKLLNVGLVYSISNSPWVSPVHCVPKKGGFTVVENEKNELIPTRLVTGWRVCIDYSKLNEATRKDHFPLPFMDQMLERLARNEHYCFLDDFSGYPNSHRYERSRKTTFTCPYGTFAYCRMPFGLCNAPGTFQRCMMAIFHDMIKKTLEVFMEDFSFFGNSFQTCLSHLEKMLKRCKDTNLCLNWEKSHFMVKEGIVLGHKISKNEIQVDKAKVKVIAKLPHPTTVKGIRSILGHAGFYRRFIKDF
nr:reverse transcriptase domain-containing protein [Tanacetum cinerariifolium]